MRILVTGGAGFIGSNIVDALVNLGHNVFIVDNLLTGKKENINPNAVFYEVDITDKKMLESIFKETRPEIVFHAAAQIDVRKSVEDPSFDAEVNVVGSVNLFSLCVRYGVKRIVFSSTGGALYGEPKEIPADENSPIEPLSAYGVAKFAVEQYLNYFKRLYGIERVILRYGNVYGSRQDPLGEAGVIAIFTGRTLNDLQPVIYGDGNQTRDYIFVEDVVRANILAMEGKEGIYNIGTGIETSVNDLVKMFSEVLNKHIEPVYAPPRKGEVQRIALDTSKAKKELGFTPKFSLEEGLKRTVDWYNKMKGRV